MSTSPEITSGLVSSWCDESSLGCDGLGWVVGSRRVERRACGLDTLSIYKNHKPLIISDATAIITGILKSNDEFICVIGNEYI